MHFMRAQYGLIVVLELRLEQCDVFEHYFWTELNVKSVGKLFIRTKVLAIKTAISLERSRM
jgi:hypothetical protein